MRHVTLVVSPLSARQNVETLQPLNSGLLLGTEIQPRRMSVVHLEKLCVKQYRGERCNCERSPRGEAMDDAQDDLLYAKSYRYNNPGSVGTSNIRHGNCKPDIDKVGAGPDPRLKAARREEKDVSVVVGAAHVIAAEPAYQLAAA